MEQALRYEYKRLALACRGLSVFPDLMREERAGALLALLEALGREELRAVEVYERYHYFYRLQAEEAWGEYLLDLIMDSNNRLSAAVGSGGKASASLKADAARDLRVLSRLARLNGENMRAMAVQRFTSALPPEEEALFASALAPGCWPVWRSFDKEVGSSFVSEAPGPIWLHKQRDKLKENFSRSEDWGLLTDELFSFYQNVGYGLFARYTVFRLNESGGLIGVERPDPIQLDGLFCQEREQGIVLRNTEFFLQGFPANNIILYGNRGTGKSSLVKALPNAYAPRKLRLIQLKKAEINYFPLLIKELIALPYRFVLFIDDLSFDDIEQDYKDMKMLLEGGVEARPENVLVYATSNRKNLIRESFSERKGDEVHVRDNIEEKLSLADRFGITVTFLTPDQETFLKIVYALAQRLQLPIGEDVLRKKALQWVAYHNARSGRSAQQFIDYLRGELAENRE